MLSLSLTCLSSPRAATVFDFSAFGRARGTCPASCRRWPGGGRERPGRPNPKAGGCGDWEGTGWVHPPARRLGSSAPGDAVSGSRAVFKKVERSIRKPTLRNSPPTRGTIPTPLPFFIPSSPASSSCPFPLPPSAYNPSPTRERDREEKMKCLFLCPNLRALSGPAVNDRPELRS